MPLPLSLLPVVLGMPLSGYRMPWQQPIALYTSDACVLHDPGPQHPEAPARLENLLNAMRNKWMPEDGGLLQVREYDSDVTDEQVLRVHTRKHLAQVSTTLAAAQLPGVRLNCGDSDTFVSQGSSRAARRAAGLVVRAVDDLMTDLRPGSPRRAFCMVRPPGHHAESNGPQGFCIFNNVMVGAAHAQQVYGVGRVAVLDFDVHHGNGGSDIAWNSADTLYVSSHQTPLYPGTGEERGQAGGWGNVVNAPLAANAGSREFRAAWRMLLLPAVRAFRPDMIFISAGFDAHVADPLAACKLSDDDFKWITREVGAIAAGKPVVSVLEGGYNVDQLERSVRAHIKALMSS